MTRAKNVIKNAKCKHGHRSAMSNSAWCDLNKNCTVLRLRDMCHSPKCNRQKQITFSRGHFQMEDGSTKSKLQKIFNGTQTAWNKVLNQQLLQQRQLLVCQLVLKQKIQKLGKRRLLF